MPEATRPAFITCARCGTEKKVGRGGPIPTYCSAACRNALSNERARNDGRYEQRLARERQQAAAQREAAARPCPYCGNPLANPRRVQCGARVFSVTVPSRIPLLITRLVQLFSWR